MKKLLSLAEPILGSAEKNALMQVIDSGWITMGDKVRQFEKDFASLHDTNDAIAVNSCTAGLHLVLAGLDLADGDEVLLPSLTFVATANSIKYTGATPVFVDVLSINEPHMSLDMAEQCVTDKTKAVIIMHYGGYLCDVKAWRDFADKHGLFLIEDAAHAPGCPGVGKHSDACCYSFFSNKNMTTCEGGIVTVSNDDLFSKLKLMRSHGMTSVTLDRHKGHAYSYDVVELGFNYRLDELRAAIGIEQLKNLLGWNQQRRDLSKRYRQQLANDNNSLILPFSADSVTSAHLMSVILPKEVNRERLMDMMRNDGIQTSIHYPPVHKFSYYQRFNKNLRLPVTEEFCKRELTLPLHPALTEQDIDYIAEKILSLI